MALPTPLSKPELTTLQDTAEYRDYFPEKLIFNIIPYTGLFVSEFKHLRRSWIDWGEDEDSIVIEVPSSDRCTPLKMTGVNTIVERTEPCYHCQQRKTDGWESGGASRVRSIPVIADPAVDQLQKWFSHYEAIPMSRTAIGKRIQRLTTKSPLSRTVDFRDLRLTFVRILAAMNFEEELILQWIGYNIKTKAIRTILDNSPNNYRDRLQTTKLLDVLKTDGPLTITVVANRTDRHYETIHERFNALHEQGYITKFNLSNPTGGGNQFLWDCDEVPECFECPDCGRTFDSHHGLGNHSGSMHGGLS